MSSPRFIKLRNGVVFDLNSVRMIVRKDLNDYNIVLADSAIMPRADIGDVEFMESLMDLNIAPVKEEPLPASRLAVAE